jgi:glutathione S-transferase
MLRFYYAPRTIALASHIALEESGLDYEPIRLDFHAQQQRTAEYLAINPKGRVPSLVTERGVLTETPAILTYIAQIAPQARLSPVGDPFAFAAIQSFMAYLCSTVHPAHAHKTRGARWSDDPAVIEALKVKVPQNMADCCAMIEKEYLKGPWVMGDAFSIADLYLFAIERWLEGDGVDTTRFARLLDHRSRMNDRPAVAKVLPLH